MKFPHVFVTGGAGYLGSALVPRLLEKGHKVTVYDLFLYGDVLEPHPNLVQVKGDIRDYNLLKDSCKDVDAVIHLACISNDPSFDLDPNLGKSINYDAFGNIIRLVDEEKINRLIVASSTSQYGIKPIEEQVTEDTSPNPISDYAKYKLMCEKQLLGSHIDSDYVFVRPATLCGYAKRLRLDLSVNILTINAIINKKIKIFGGSQMRPALNIKDMVRFYEIMLEAPREIIHKQAFNVSCTNKTIQEIANMVRDTIQDDDIEFVVTPSDDNRSYHVNTDKALNILDFKCEFTIEDAIKSIVEAYNSGLIVDALNNPLYYNIKRMQEINLK